MPTETDWMDTLRWDKNGLIPAIVQDAGNGEVLMMAWMDRPALIETLRTRQTHFYSRSRQAHWHKGGTSGHVQHVESIRVDCDADILLIQARQIGGACHEGYRSCFYRELLDNRLVIRETPIFDTNAVYDRPTESPSGTP